MPKLTTSDGVTLQYSDTGGTGRPLVLIHGWPLAGAAFHRNIPAFVGAGLRVITYDRRGFGASDKPQGGYDYDTLSADAEAVLEHLDLHEAVVLGFSMGGGEAAHLASGNPQRIAAVIFAGAITPALCTFDDNPDGAMPFSAFSEMSGACDSDRDGFLDSFIRTFFSTADGGLQVDEGVRRAALELAHQSGHKAAVDTILIWASDLRRYVKDIHLPTLVIHGDADQNVPFDHSAARMPGIVAGAQLVTLTGAPHGANESHAEQWESAIIEFIAGLS